MLTLKPKSTHTTWRDVAVATLKRDDETIEDEDGNVVATLKRVDVSLIDSFQSRKLRQYAQSLRNALASANVATYDVVVASDSESGEDVLVLVKRDA